MPITITEKEPNFSDWTPARGEFFMYNDYDKWVGPYLRTRIDEAWIFKGDLPEPKNWNFKVGTYRPFSRTIALLLGLQHLYSSIAI